MCVASSGERCYIIHISRRGGACSGQLEEDCPNTRKLLHRRTVLIHIVKSMRISKFLTVALALSTAAAGSLFARPDSDVQAKARAALREAESDQTSTNTVAPAAKTTPAPMIKPAA